MALIKSPVFGAPTFATAPGAKQRRVVIPHHDSLVGAPLRQAIHPERATSAVPGSRVEESAVLQGAFGTQDTSFRTFQDVVLGIVAEPSHRNARADRLGLGWNDGINAALLESGVDLRVGIACIGSHCFRSNPRGFGSLRRPVAR